MFEELECINERPKPSLQELHLKTNLMNSPLSPENLREINRS